MDVRKEYLHLAKVKGIDTDAVAQLSVDMTFAAGILKVIEK